uniref:OTU domain-containing protein n=1 Tax=Amphimedon queenslandica TaxID=400682 RepID=A0A1X7UTG2_AMPQE
MMSSLLMKSLPTKILWEGDNGIMCITLVMKDFKEGGEILNLKFLTAVKIFPGSPNTPLSDKSVPNSTLDVPADGSCLFNAISCLITWSFSQHYE